MDAFGTNTPTTRNYSQIYGKLDICAKAIQSEKIKLTEYQNGVVLLNVLLQKVLEFGEAAQPVITVLCLVSFIPVVNVFVSFVVIREEVHVSVKQKKSRVT